MRNRMSNSALCAVLISLVSVPPVAAASKTGSDLLGQCQINSRVAVIACHLYIHAVQDVLEDNTVNGFRVCIPANFGIDDSVDLIVVWLNKHPEEERKPASEAVAHALWETYPCK
jgi:hypothetical protein